MTGAARPGTLHEALLRSARRDPGHPAVQDGTRVLSYAELADWSGRISGLLHSAGVRAGDRVGLCLPKSAEAIAAMYGVMGAGAVHVPIDPGLPVARRAAITADCGIRVVFAAGRTALGWQAGVRILDPAAVPDLGAAPPLAAGLPDDLAYILYTSGSTGTPKGVMLTHRAGLAFASWAAAHFALTGADRVACPAPLHFDLSTLDLFAAALTGATTVIVPTRAAVYPAELARFLDTSGVTVFYAVPSLLGMLTRRGGLAPGDLPRLRAMLFAGEVFPTGRLAELMTLLPHVRFANLYGPTETNVCTCHEVARPAPGETAPIPIGTPIDGVRVVATRAGRETAPGETGELHVSGPTVMRGYWGDTEGTALVLVPSRGGTAYRTGDLARRDAAGVYHLIGRRDHQVKSRGYRIELGDVEAALHADQAVGECAVLAVPDSAVTNRLVAWVAPAADTDASALARNCALRLPRYMIPEHFELCENLPRTSTGKVDRAQLAKRSLALFHGPFQ